MTDTGPVEPDSDHGWPSRPEMSWRSYNSPTVLELEALDECDSLAGLSLRLDDDEDGRWTLGTLALGPDALRQVAAELVARADSIERNRRVSESPAGTA